MSKFCEGCPAKFTAEADIVGVTSVPIRLGSIATDISCGVVLDRENGYSEGILVPSNETKQKEIVDRVAECERPSSTKSMLPFKKDRVECPAIGFLMIPRGRLNRSLQKAVEEWLDSDSSD